MQIPVRLGPAELSLIEQLQAAGATAAAERLAASGLPTRKVESYHYTDLKTLLRAVPGRAVEAGDASEGPFDMDGAFVAQIVNGTALVAGAPPVGVNILKAAGSALSERDDVLVRLNIGLASESLVLEIAGDVTEPIHIDRRIVGQAAHALSSARVFVADGAHATIIETYTGSDAAHVGNDASYISLGRGAHLTHISIDLSGATATHFATHEYELAAGAQLRTLAVQAGSVLSRTLVAARFAGEGAHADFSGLNLVTDGQHHDITIDVTHAVANTTSKEMYKQIARGRSKAVFQGRILVARDAQKTDAKMSMQGLMLSDEAEILSKPELEIYADDVVCGHGSTCGDLDETALFYLMSRGIARADAEVMLVRAFLAELVEPITDAAVQAAATQVIETWLAGAR